MTEKSTLPTTYIPRVVPAYPDQAASRRANLYRAQAAFARIAKLSSGGDSGAGARAIAENVGSAVRQAVVDAVPYGRPVDAEIDIAHQGADGSKTTARMRLKIGAHPK